MADGLWTGVGATEVLRQGPLTRHRLLAVNTSAAGARAADGSDASSYASVNPNVGPPGIALPDGGPHFVMSPEAPGGLPTHGFEWGFCDAAVIHQTPGIQAQFAAAGVDITVWVLIAATFFPNGGDNPQWASFQTLVGAQPSQLFRSFDVDPSALRFQFAPAGITVDGVVVMFFSEL
jgi:hypothetical protein